MRFLIFFALAYFAFKTVRKLLSNVKIINQAGVNIKNQSAEPSAKIKLDESDIEDADFKEVE